MKRVLLLLPFLLVQSLFAQSTDVIRLAETAIRSGLLKPGGGTHRLQVGVGYPNKIVAGIKSIDLLDNIAGIDLGGVGEVFGLEGNNRIEGEGSASPQYNLSFDFAINEKLSIGPYLGYAQATSPILVLDVPEIPGITLPIIGEVFSGLDAIKGEYRYDFQLYSYGLRAVLNEWAANEKLQLYVMGYVGFTKYVVTETVIAGDRRGLETAGLIDQLFSDNSFNSTTPNISVAGQIGGRFNFSEKVGIFLEAGYGLNIFNGGLVFNFHKKKVQAKEDAMDAIDAGDLKKGTSN